MRQFRTLGIRTLGVAVVAAAVALLPAQAVHAQAVPAASAKYVQMSNASAPDPDLEIFGSRYYVYATSGSDGVLPVFVSDTASIRGGFRQAGNILTRAPQGFTGLWAPHVIHAGGWYIAFFTAAYKGGDHAVYWVYSRFPDHGFSQAPAEIASSGAAGWEAIDPTTYAGAGNKLYLVWRRGHYTAGFPYGTFQIKARQIAIATVGGKPRITFAAGAARQLAQVTGNAPVMEAPSLLYRNNHLWLFVARGAFNDYKVPYRTDVWSAAGITGTFRERRTVLAGGEGWGTGPGSASVIAHGGIVYIAYHAWQGKTRVTRFARLAWQGDVPVAEPLPASASA
jgi:beta-xylosidase